MRPINLREATVGAVVKLSRTEQGREYLLKAAQEMEETVERIRRALRIMQVEEEWAERRAVGQDAR